MIRQRANPSQLLKLLQARARRVSARRQRTHTARWRANLTEEPSWDARNIFIASLIIPRTSILDIGSGAQTLRDHLDPSCSYRACDVVPKTRDTWTIDFNRNIYPHVNSRFDYCILSGALEYASRPREVLEHAADYGRIIILSYSPLGSSTLREREGQGWFNHLTRAQLERLFESVGLSYREVGVYNDQLVYELRGHVAG
jgi:hypothetical protein